MATKFDQNSVNISRQQTGQTNLQGQARAAANTSHSQSDPTPEEYQERMKTRHTKGRKGCWQHRINMCFSEDNWQYLQIMGTATGMNMTQFNNYILDEYRKAHHDIYDQVLATRQAMGMDQPDQADDQEDQEDS